MIFLIGVFVTILAIIYYFFPLAVTVYLVLSYTIMGILIFTGGPSGKWRYLNWKDAFLSWLISPLIAFFLLIGATIA